MRAHNQILLVEDDDALSAAITKFLGIQNDVEVAPDLATAREKIADTDFDIVLLDKGLPDGDGISLLPEIKGKQATTAVIVMTGDSEFNSVTKCLAAGADDYIVKSDNLIPELFVRIPVAINSAALKEKHTTLRCLSGLVVPSTEAELGPDSYTDFMKEAEKAFLSAVLAIFEGDAGQAALALGLGKSTVFKKMADLDLPRRQWQRTKLVRDQSAFAGKN